MRNGLWIMVVVLVLLLAANTATAAKTTAEKATARGNIFIGGDSNVAYSGEDVGYEGDKSGPDAKTTRFQLTGMGGFFIAQNVELGGLLDFRNMKTDYNNDDTTTKAFDFGPQLGFFLPLNPSVASGISLFALLPFGYSQTTVDYSSGSKQEHSGFFLEPRIGSMFHILGPIAFGASFSYRYYKGSGDKLDVKETGYALRIGIYGFL